MAKKKHKKSEQMVAAFRMVESIQEMLKEFREGNPDVDIDKILSVHEELRSVLGHVQNLELAKFAAYAKEQGTRMSFGEMEMGVLDAGRKDMQNTLTDIAESLKFDTPTCSEDGTNMRDCGLVKKNL